MEAEVNGTSVEAQAEQQAKEGVVEATLTAKKSPTGQAVTASVVWSPGQNLQEAVEKYGEKDVFDLYRRSAVIKLQAAMRSRLEQGATPEQVSQEFASWRPDVDRQPTRDPKQTILSNFNKLSPEEREALLAQLRGDEE